jgi:hypothetical protein
MADRSITVYGDQDRGAVSLYTGLLHGFEEGDPIPVDEIRGLHPSSWRICKWWQYDYVREFTDVIQFGVSFSWRWYQYGNPADDIDLWKEYVAAHVYYSLETDRKIDYWDIWNEPDHEYFWSWSYEDLLLTFKSAHEVITSIDPGAKIIGPSFAKFYSRDNFNYRSVADFITDLYATHAVLLDAVSWHMNDEWFAWIIPGHAQTLRNAIETIGEGYDPKLVINEYTQSLIVLRPVYHLSFVWHMDRAGIDFSNLACWELYKKCTPPETYSSCWAGLNGLFTNDYSAEQHPYWFYRWHAREAGNRRLVVSEPEYNTLALASKNEGRREIVICVGKHDHSEPVEDVTITVLNYPYSTDFVDIEVSLLVDGHQVCFGNEWEALQVPCPEGPRTVFEGIRKVENGTLVMKLDDFEDEDLCFIRIRDYPFIDVCTMPVFSWFSP